MPSSRPSRIEHIEIDDPAVRRGRPGGGDRLADGVAGLEAGEVGPHVAGDGISEVGGVGGGGGHGGRSGGWLGEGPLDEDLGGDLGLRKERVVVGDGVDSPGQVGVEAAEHQPQRPARPGGPRPPTGP